MKNIKNYINESVDYWKNTKLIGIGFPKDEKGGTYIVSNF